jgi:phenylalanyl-tRNA synthetase beta subunit
MLTQNVNTKIANLPPGIISKLTTEIKDNTINIFIYNKIIYKIIEQSTFH